MPFFEPSALLPVYGCLIAVALLVLVGSLGATFKTRRVIGLTPVIFLLLSPLWLESPILGALAAFIWLVATWPQPRTPPDSEERDQPQSEI